MERSDDKLGTMPIGRLLLVMSAPNMISMFVQALYNLVDSMFVAQISENALTAVSLAFPMQSIMMSIAVGTGVGGNAMISRCLGHGDRDKAEKAANVQIFLCACYSVLFAVLGLGLSRAFYVRQTDVEEIITYGEQYLTIVCALAVGSFYGQSFEKILISTGNSTLSMISQAAGAVANIIFDPLLIFGVGPFPEMGVRGAAVATVLGQALAAMLAFYFNRKYNNAVGFRISRILPNREILFGIYAVGFPSMITIGLGSVMSYCMNQILLAFSTTAAAVFGIWLKMQSFGFMPVFGMNNGTIAMYSYNFGAKKYDRVHQTLRLAMIVGLAVTTAVTVLYLLTPRLMLRLFNASETMYAIGIPALRACVLSMPFGACAVVLSSCFQSLGRSRYTLLLNFCRQLIIQVPAAWLLSLGGALLPVWFAPLIAEAGSLFIALALRRKVMRLLPE